MSLSEFSEVCADNAIQLCIHSLNIYLFALSFQFDSNFFIPDVPETPLTLEEILMQVCRFVLLG